MKFMLFYEVALMFCLQVSICFDRSSCWNVYRFRLIRRLLETISKLLCSCTLYVLFLSSVQEEIKITGVTVFLNPYSEPDEEEEEEKAKDEKNAEDEDKVSFWILSTVYFLLFQILVCQNIICFMCFFTFQDQVGSWYSHPGTGTETGAVVGGGVGKYLKAKSAPVDSAADDSGLTAIATTKKRKVGVSAGEFKDFSGW